MQLRRGRDELVADLEWYGAALIPNLLSGEELDAYTRAARALEYTDRSGLYGKRGVRQSMASAEVTSGTGLYQLAVEIEEAVRSTFAEGDFATRLAFNSRKVQRYPAGSVGIDPHLDESTNRSLIVLFGLSGLGLFTTYAELEGPVRKQYMFAANSLVLLRAPGFLGSNQRPLHGISQIRGGDDGYRYVLAMRQTGR